MINIITCVWNAEKYIKDCIDSVKQQKNQKFRMFIVDDASNDSSVQIIKTNIENYNNIIFIQNIDKKYKLKNFDEIISDTNIVNDEDIIIELDGDDKFANTSVIDTIYKTYENNNTLIANSNFVYQDGRIGFSSSIDISKIRQSPFAFSHLRSWKSSLWRSVNKKYFIDPRTNNYFKITADMAYSFPMLEIAGQHRYTYIPEILLIYNDISPYNDHKSGSGSGGRKEQITVEQIVRTMI